LGRSVVGECVDEWQKWVGWVGEEEVERDEDDEATLNTIKEVRIFMFIIVVLCLEVNDWF